MSEAVQPNLFHKIGRKLRTGLVYVLMFHVIRILSDGLIPNSHGGNRLRGVLYAPFFKSCGRRFAIASGTILNSAWNMDVGDDVYIAHRCWINAAGGLTIEDGCILSPNVVIATTAHGRENDAVSLQLSKQSPIRIGKGAWVASNAVVTRGSTIGEGAVVGACSVVAGSLEPHTLYAGNPIRMVKSLK